MTDSEKLPSIGRLYLQKQYPQNRVMSASDFERFCRDRRLAADRERLEFLEREGLVRPVLRIIRAQVPYKRVVEEKDGRRQEYLAPLAEGEDLSVATDFEYAAISNDQFSLQSMAEEGLVEFPEEVPFRPWRDYRHGNGEETAFAYYHPLQILLIKKSRWLGTIVFDSEIVDAPTKEIAARVAEGRKRRDFDDKLARGQLESTAKLMRFLMTVEDAIVPDLRHVFASADPRRDIDDQLADWLDWRKRLDWKALLAGCGFAPSDLKDLHTRWSVDALSLDPMENWYTIVTNIPHEKRQKLKGDARLAQDYYEVALMLEAAHHAVTGEHLLPPDDIMDARRGAWKERWYGTRDVFRERRARLILLTEYGLNPIIRIHLIVEGLTEEIVITRLASFLGIDFESLGIELHNIGGVGHLKFDHLCRLLWHALDEGSVAYVVVDNDEGARAHTDRLIDTRDPGGEPLLREEFRTIWKGEFEEDNFSYEEIVDALKRLARSQGIETHVSVEDLRVYFTSNAGKPKKVTKALKQLAWEKMSLDLEGHREKLAELLAEIAIEKINERVASVGAYEPVTGIEKELRKVAKLAYALGKGARMGTPSK